MATSINATKVTTTAAYPDGTENGNNKTQENWNEAVYQEFYKVLEKINEILA